MILVLFDVDGTLVNVRGAGRWSLARAFEATFGGPEVAPAVAGVRFDGRTDPDIIADIAAAAGISRSRLDAAMSELEESYLAILKERLLEIGAVEPLPGVVGLLEALGTRRHAAGLLTGNTRTGAYLKLAAAGLDKRFVEGAFGDDGPDRSSLGKLARERFCERAGRTIPASDVVVIGDAPEDVRAARANGYRSLAVGTGWTELGVLRVEGADLTLPDLSATEEVLRWIERGGAAM